MSEFVCLFMEGRSDEIGRVSNLTRGQKHLAKAASNASHTLPAQNSLAVAVPVICRQLKKLYAICPSRTSATPDKRPPDILPLEKSSP